MAKIGAITTRGDLFKARSIKTIPAEEKKPAKEAFKYGVNDLGAVLISFKEKKLMTMAPNSKPKLATTNG